MMEVVQVFHERQHFYASHLHIDVWPQGSDPEDQAEICVQQIFSLN